MGLKKGMTNNPTGRPVGSKNKVSIELRENITEFLSENFNKVKEDFKKLSPKDRLTFYKDLLKFSVPQLQNTNLELGFERLPDDQLDVLINNLKSAINDQD